MLPLLGTIENFFDRFARELICIRNLQLGPLVALTHRCVSTLEKLSLRDKVNTYAIPESAVLLELSTYSSIPSIMTWGAVNWIVMRLLISARSWMGETVTVAEDIGERSQIWIYDLSFNSIYLEIFFFGFIHLCIHPVYISSDNRFVWGT